MKKLLEEYFTFSRKDRIGILVLIALILIVSFLPPLITAIYTRKTPPADTASIAAIRKLEAPESTKKVVENEVGYPNDRDESRPAHLFAFDPNTLTVNGWKELGLRDKTIHTITNYLSKGGHFRKPEDLQRIYGLREEEYQRLLPYVTIAPAPETAGGSRPFEKFSSSAKPFHPISIDINTADTSAFIALPGIGSKLALRIVTFREKLGGFHAVEQIGETYGLPDSVFQLIRPRLLLSDPVVRKIDLNTATIDELKAHPYIRYTLATPIIRYRDEHGPFARLEDLRNVMAVTEEAYNKIAPYLIVR